MSYCAPSISYQNDITNNDNDACGFYEKTRVHLDNKRSVAFD